MATSPAMPSEGAPSSEDTSRNSTARAVVEGSDAAAAVS